MESAKQFTCTACGRPESELPADHEMTNATDAFGWPILICNYGTMLNTYKIECWGGGGSAEADPDT